MDSERLSTRKGFFKRAGLAVAAALGASGSTGAASGRMKPSKQNGVEVAANVRVQTARGAVAREV